MGTDDKLKNTAQKAKGKGKVVAGNATDNQSLRDEGKRDQRKADLKQGGEKVKDAFKK